jgi:pyridoxal phosphate enzyme (YggS family)
MTEIQEKYQAIASQLVDKSVTLVPVSKKKPVEDLMQIYEIGGRIFGENYVQELTEKYEQMPKDIEWQLLGHLQRNKVKYIAPFVNLIHSVDSLKLLREINKQAAKNERVINCLLQVFIAEEDSKTGMDENELPEAFAALSDLPNVKVVGLMGISTFTDNKEVVIREFRHLRKLYDEGKSSHPEWNVLSMGMSGDWQMAIEEGSTLIRVGTSIFGART